MFKRKTIRYVDVEEMKELLEYARKYRFVIFGPPELPLMLYAYVEDTMSYVRLTMKYNEKACTWIFRKDLVDCREQITGMDAYTELAKDYVRATGEKIPLIEEPVGSARALLSFRNDTNQKRMKAICYDQNSAYAIAMTKPMPDTRHLIGEYRKVQDGEIGFRDLELAPVEGWTFNTTPCLQMVLPGEGTAEKIFPSMPSPFTAFSQRWFIRKLEGDTPQMRHKAKQMLVFSVGYLQRKNPYLRAAVVEYANKSIRSVIDKNTIYCNTDSIVSLEERPDLNIGEYLGQFKIEHQGDFAHVGFNYQWNLDKPSYRGIPNSWFPEDWDILKDPSPENHNIYELDRTTLEIIDYTKEWNNNEI